MVAVLEIPLTTGREHIKQRITPTQYNELSQSAKDTYRHWAFERGYGGHMSGQKVDVSVDYDFLPDMPTIGIMIQFLDEHWNEVYIHNNHVTLVWTVSYQFEGNAYYVADDLVDALWSACKEILNGR